MAILSKDTDARRLAPPVIFNSQGRLSTKIGATERIDDYLVPHAVTCTVTGEHGARSLRMTFEVRQARPECVASQLVAGKDGRGLRSADLAGLDVDGRSRAELEAVASVYRRNPASPVRAVEQLLGCSRRTATRRAAEAKEPGLLDNPPCSPESTAPKPSQAQVRAALRQRGHDVPSQKKA